MQAFLEYVVKQLVDHPEEVQVTQVAREDGPLFELRMRRSDVGKVVGRQGQTISAIRNVLSSAFSVAGRRLDVEIVEDELDSE